MYIVEIFQLKYFNKHIKFLYQCQIIVLTFISNSKFLNLNHHHSPEAACLERIALLDRWCFFEVAHLPRGTHASEQIFLLKLNPFMFTEILNLLNHKIWKDSLLIRLPCSHCKHLCKLDEVMEYDYNLNEFYINLVKCPNIRIWQGFLKS